jgi:O-antigen ligase
LVPAPARTSTPLLRRVSPALAWIAALTVLVALALPTAYLPAIALGCAVAFALLFPSRSWDTVDLATLAFAAAWLVSALASPLKVDAGPTLTCLAVAWGVARIRDRRVVLALVAGLIALGCLVLTQVAVLSAHAQLSGADRPGEYIALAEWGGYPELGFLGVIVLPLVVGIGLHAPTTSSAAAAAIMAIAAGAGILLSVSRASWVASAAATGLLLLTTRLRRATLAVLLLVGLVGLAWARVPLLSTYGAVLVSGTASTPVGERTRAWRMATELWRERWLVGWGPDAYRQAFIAHFQAPAVFASVHAHNELLQIAVETGLVGVSAALWLAGATLTVAWRGFRSATGIVRGARAGLLAGLVGAAVRFQFDYFDPGSGPQRVMLVLSIVAGLAVALARIERTPPGKAAIA